MRIGRGILPVASHVRHVRSDLRNRMAASAAVRTRGGADIFFSSGEVTSLGAVVSEGIFFSYRGLCIRSIVGRPIEYIFS
jgi:hypothetical protein